MPNIKELREKNKPVKSTSIKDFTRQWYHSTEWRNFREESRKLTRAKHESIVFELYENIPENDPDVLFEFLTDPKQYPLSELSLKEGIIERATVLDHIRPIRYGGCKTCHENVQWITAKQHKEKTLKENNANW